MEFQISLAVADRRGIQPAKLCVLTTFPVAMTNDQFLLNSFYLLSWYIKAYGLTLSP